jgi:radical SAM protein with 4Fe4S-binding SPASM domain
LTAAVVLRVVGDAVPLGLRCLALSGGEPLLHPEFRQILVGCRSLGLNRLQVYTSGVVRSSEGAPVPLRDAGLLACVRENNAELVFSVESSDPSVHDTLVGASPRHSVLVESLHRAIAEGIHVECNIVPNKLNLSTLAVTAGELVRLGVSRVNFLRLVPQGYARDNRERLWLRPSDLAELDEVFSNIRSLPRAGELFRFGVPFSARCGSPGQCQAGLSKLIVRWDGIVLPCEAFKDCENEEFELGDVRGDSLSVIYDRAASNLALDTLRAGIKAADPCPAQSLYQ